MSNVVSSALFCVRNVDKTQNGSIGRAPVTVGQGKNVFDYVTSLDNGLGKGARAAVDTLKAAAESEKILAYAGKAIDFASKNINPLICVSAGIDVLRADDKESALITNTTALTSMFAVESLMKKHLGDIPKMECMEGISEEVMNFARKYKCEGTLPMILQGVAFVIGSCTAYNIGQKFGKLLLGKQETINGKQ